MRPLLGVLAPPLLDRTLRGSEAREPILGGEGACRNRDSLQSRSSRLPGLCHQLSAYRGYALIRQGSLLSEREGPAKGTGPSSFAFCRCINLRSFARERANAPQSNEMLPALSGGRATC